ncbi:MAG: hypothetical protein FD174_3019 [Geobacteraceae bacterium]|nr:MAG: hypothetical protein FD174_3019 [Geobacteraceae bacterium]
MECRKKIDESLKERHGIVHLLERLKKENISLDEMEEIGAKLQKSGRRALLPLVRRLWRERSGDLISRYAFMLDFFDDDVWIDQLIQIALRRNDLEEEGKAALLAALKGYGVDVNAPPFARLLAEAGGLLELTLPRLLEMGEEGEILFMDDFVYCPQEARLAIIREMAKISDQRVLSLLEILLWFDNPDVVRETVVTLGKIRNEGAVALLHAFQPYADESVKELVERSLRRLAFLGIHSLTPLTATPPLPFHSTYASPIDGAGYRSLWLSRRMGGSLSTLYLHLHEIAGIKATWGSSAITDKEYESQLAEICSEEGMVEITPDYTMLLIRDSLYRSRQNFTQLPPEFYVRRGILRGENITPAPYIPEFTEYDPKDLAVSSRRVAESSALFDDEYFAGWFMANARVYDFAEEWNELEKADNDNAQVEGVESILARFCRELIVPETERIRERLLLTADLMRQTGREKGVMEKTLAAAHSIGSAQAPDLFHPFLKRFAFESIDMAREALAEGYDLRQHPFGEDDDDWE